MPAHGFRLPKEKQSVECPYRSFPIIVYLEKVEEI